MIALLMFVPILFVMWVLWVASLCRRDGTGEIARLVRDWIYVWVYGTVLCVVVGLLVWGFWVQVVP